MHGKGKIKLKWIISKKRKMKLEEIKEILKKHKKELQENFKIKNMGIFGSYVRGEQREASDVDILVEFYETPDLLKFIELVVPFHFQTLTASFSILSLSSSLIACFLTRSTLTPRISSRYLSSSMNLSKSGVS